MPCSIPNCSHHWWKLPPELRGPMHRLWRQGLGRGQEYIKLFAECVCWTVEREVPP